MPGQRLRVMLDPVWQRTVAAIYRTRMIPLIQLLVIE